MSSFERPAGRHRRHPAHAQADRPRRAGAVLGRVGIAVLSLLVMTLTGMGWWVSRHLAGGITVSQALGLDAPRSTDGSMNILLIGLDSRKDLHGNDLPREILDQLHAGGSSPREPALSLTCQTVKQHCLKPGGQAADASIQRSESL